MYYLIKKIFKGKVIMGQTCINSKLKPKKLSMSMKTMYVICFFPFCVYDSNQFFALDLCLLGYVFWEILFLFFLIWFFKRFFLQILFLCFVDLVFCTTFFLQVVFLQVLFLCLGCTSIFNFKVASLQLLGFFFSRCIDIPNVLFLYVIITKVWHYKVTHLFQEPR